MQETINRLIVAKQNMPGALLPILHDIQDALGYIPADSIAPSAQALNLSRAEVHGVVTFYHHFKTEAARGNVIQICKAEACQSMGAEALWKHACKLLALDAEGALHGATTPDRSVTLEPVYCLGLCSTSPAMTVNGRVHARVACADFDRLLNAAGSQP